MSSNEKQEITITKKEFEELIRESVTDTAAEIGTEIDMSEGFKCTLFGAMIAQDITNKLFKKEDLEVEKDG